METKIENVYKFDKVLGEYFFFNAITKRYTFIININKNRGSFGVVKKITKKSTGELFAVKIMNK